MKFDLSNAESLGELPDYFIQSICWECARPVSECEWLTKGKAYKGKYYERPCKGYYVDEKIYTIAECERHC